MAGMMDNWILVYTTTDHVEAMIISGMLEQNQVPVTIINRQDSSYVFLGDIELHVPVHLKELAKNLIDGSILN
jgi:hypothetical protein